MAIHQGVCAQKHSKLRASLEAGVYESLTSMSTMLVYLLRTGFTSGLTRSSKFDYFDDWSQLTEDKAIAPYLTDWKIINVETLLEFIPDERLSPVER